MSPTFEMLVIIPAILLPTIAYFVRLERRLTKIETRLEFIMGGIPGCQQHSDKNT